MAFKIFNVAKAGSLLHAFYVNVFGFITIILKILIESSLKL